MRIAFTDEQESLRQELKGYFAALSTEYDLDESFDSESGDAAAGGTYKSITRRLGQDGWLGLGWPKEYGGQDRSMVDQLIFADEAMLAGIPLPTLTLSTVGPMIMEYGTEEQKQLFLPQIVRGELHFSIGYSEPRAAPIWPTSVPGPPEMARSTSSMARRCGPA